MLENPTKTPTVVRSAQALYFLNTLIWLVLGLVNLVSVTDGYPEKTVMAAVIGVMMFGNALLMLFSGFWIGKPGNASFFFALAVLAINIILTFTDQFGWTDFGTLLIDLTILGLLLVARRYFIHEGVEISIMRTKAKQKMPLRLEKWFNQHIYNIILTNIWTYSSLCSGTNDFSPLAKRLMSTVF